MSAIVKISDLSTRIGTVLPSIEGRIVSVFPPKDGKGQYGEWKLQNIMIEDATGKTQVTLSQVDTVSELAKGKNIYFESVGTKFGLKGVSCEESTYTDKKTNLPVTKIGLKVTSTALIKLEGAEFVQSHPNETIEATMLKDAIKAKQATLSHPISQSVPQTSTAPNLVDQLRRYEVLYQMCLNKALKMRVPEGSVIELETSEVKDVATTFFIQSVKDGLLSQVMIGDFKNPELESNEIPF